jgi:hypothetical protein
MDQARCPGCLVSSHALSGESGHCPRLQPLSGVANERLILLRYEVYSSDLGEVGENGIRNLQSKETQNGTKNRQGDTKADLSENETPQKTQLQASSLRGISFGVDLDICTKSRSTSSGFLTHKLLGQHLEMFVEDP